MRALTFVLPTALLLNLVLLSRAASPLEAPFEIQVVDSDTGRGVPLVELETVNHVYYLTDSAGRIALSEPSLKDQTVFFYVHSHGYEFPKDGFGMVGLRFK